MPSTSSIDAASNGTAEVTTRMSSQPESRALITRRAALLRVSALFGGMLVGGEALLTACTSTAPRRGPLLFTSAEIALLDEIAETMLPETDTPGAKAAGVGPFMALMVADAYDAAERRVFRDGLDRLEERCREMHGTTFMSAGPAERLMLLEQLDREQLEHMNAREEAAPAHYFRMIKELALLGYFTSAIGYQQAMRYVEVPGRFEPCVPLTPGEKSWAPHA